MGGHQSRRRLGAGGGGEPEEEGEEEKTLPLEEEEEKWEEEEEPLEKPPEEEEEEPLEKPKEEEMPETFLETFLNLEDFPDTQPLDDQDPEFAPLSPWNGHAAPTWGRSVNRGLPSTTSLTELPGKQ